MSPAAHVRRTEPCASVSTSTSMRASTSAHRGVRCRQILECSRDSGSANADGEPYEVRVYVYCIRCCVAAIRALRVRHDDGKTNARIAPGKAASASLLARLSIVAICADCQQCRHHLRMDARMGQQPRHSQPEDRRFRFTSALQPESGGWDQDPITSPKPAVAVLMVFPAPRRPQKSSHALIPIRLRQQASP